MTSPADKELEAAYNYYVVVNPTLLQEGGDSFFIYFGVKYWMSDIREFCRRQSELNDAPELKPVKIPRF